EDHHGGASGVARLAVSVGPFLRERSHARRAVTFAPRRSRGTRRAARTSLESPVICPACQAENVPQNKFCGECGARLPAPCGAGGPPTPAGQKFCGECGAPLTAASTSAPPASPTPAPSVPLAPPVAAPAPPRAEPAVAAAPLPSPGPGAAF